MGFMWSAGLVLLTAIAIHYVPKLLNPDPPLRDIQGWCAPGWRKVADAFRANLKSGVERGGALAVYFKGEKVVDVYGGYRDCETESYWKQNTLGLFFSSTKLTAALAVAHLVDKGLMDYDSLVSKYWPDFAQNGKENITVKMLMTHSAGLWDTNEDFSLEEFKNPKKMSEILARQKPLAPPGTTVTYHGFTFGMYADQLVRHADLKHRGLKEYLQEEIFTPFGIDFFLGLPKELLYRASRYHRGSITLSWNNIATIPTFINMLFLSNSTWRHPSFLMPVFKQIKNPDLFELPLASLFGFSTANDFAKLMGIIANGGKTKDGKVLLSEKTIKILGETSSTGKDMIFGTNKTFGLGIVPIPNPKGQYTIGSPGHGGQMAYADPHYGLSHAFVTTYINPLTLIFDPRYFALKDAMYECAENALKK